jgi:hypothetical protein
MSSLTQREVDQNFDYFERNLARYLVEHPNQYVLLHERQEIAFFDRAIDAYQEGKRRFPDGKFSIQQVTDEPLDLGFLTLA